ncbi:AAEL012878-PA [Aedes aegypti]|uniref:AAEL012878-PA n=1 Tax=Aedes aegypti TaxID=7159 RepID=Q16KT1_AEDAE|nr:AAEL012878-PA [Aedes aegypti]
MSYESDEVDEDIRTLISESVDLADELFGVIVQEELSKTKTTILKELESEVESYARQIGQYTTRLQRLELLEQGMLHRLNNCSALAKEFDQLTDLYQAKVSQLRDLLDHSITFEFSKLLAKDVFQKMYGFKDELDQLEEKLGESTDLINKEDNQEIVQTLSHLKRKTSKMMQDMDNLLGLNSMHKLTVMGFSNKIYYDDQKSQGA